MLMMLLLPSTVLAWSPRVMDAMLDTFFMEYDWVNDYGVRKLPGQYPRLYNFNLSAIATMYYDGEPLRYRAAMALSRWDVVILQFFWLEQDRYWLQREMIDSIRAHHPDIILLMYLPGGAFPPVRRERGDTLGYLRRLVFDSLDAHNWWIKRPDGGVYQRSKWWKVNYYHYPEAVTWMRDFILRCLERFPYFDGVMLDLVYSRKLISNWHNIDSLIDIDENGINDWEEHDSSWVIERVQEGLANLLMALRDTLGDDFIITGNSGYPWYITDEFHYDSVYWAALANGNMSEEILDLDGLGQWEVHGPMLAMRAAWQNQLYAYANPIHFMGEATIDYWGEDTCDTGHIWRERQQMRYTLCICLMTNGFYSYDTGGKGGHTHSEIWWFPEYNCNLGYALSDTPQYLHDPNGNPYMRRDFENGIVLLNASFESGGGGPTVEVQLDDVYWDIAASDTTSHVFIPQYDGRILLSEWPSVVENREQIVERIEPDIRASWQGRRSVRIEYSVDHQTDVDISVYAVTGRLVKEVVKVERHPRGRFNVEWDMRDGQGIRVGSGVYILRMEFGDGRAFVRKFIVLGG